MRLFCSRSIILLTFFKKNGIIAKIYFALHILSIIQTDQAMDK